MVNSNERKLNLSGWLLEKNIVAYNSPLKLQKFLLFYELMSKVNGEKTDFTYLKGYQKGPVFSVVWGDYTKDRNQFNSLARSTYMKNKKNINERIAIICNYLVSILNEIELSELTHKLNLWSNKEKLINSGQKQVELSESDFDDIDKKMIETLEKMYSIEEIENSIILPINDINFVISKEQYPMLTETHLDTLMKIVKNEELHNPVYIEIDEEGALAID